MKSKNILDNPVYKATRERWDHYTNTLELCEVPLHVDIELTNICALSCMMCERKLMTRPRGMMSMEIFKRIVDEAHSIGVDSLKLNLWGESILHKKMMEMIRYAKTSTPLILQFNTSADAMSCEISEGFIREGLDKITISIDAVNSKTYEKIRAGANFDRVMSNIHHLIDTRKKAGSSLPNITVQMVRMTENLSEVDDFVRYWTGKADNVSVIDIVATTADKDVLKLATWRARTKRKPCEQLFQRLSVLWDGTVTMCCSDYDGFLTIGNINKDSLKDLWLSGKLQEMRRRHKTLDFGGTVCDICSYTVKE